MEDRKYPRFAEALKVYGPTPRAQARTLGIPYTTLREWLRDRWPQNMIKLACRRELLIALSEDLANQPGRCPDPVIHPTDQAA